MPPQKYHGLNRLKYIYPLEYWLTVKMKGTQVSSKIEDVLLLRLDGGYVVVYLSSLFTLSILLHSAIYVHISLYFLKE